MDIISVWLLNFLFFAAELRYVISLFHPAESLPLCNSYYLFTLLFLSKKNRHG